MIIANAKDSHEGDYLCQASNGIGSGKSKLVSLSVDGKKIMAMQELNTLNPNSIQYPKIQLFKIFLLFTLEQNSVNSHF